jgi:phosphonate transport system substrate-binding protein
LSTFAALVIEVARLLAPGAATTLLALSTAVTAWSPQARAQGAALRFTGIPDEPAEERERRFAPLGRYLEARLGVAVVYTAATDYQGAVDAIKDRRADVAWLTGLHFLQAKAAAGGNVLPLVQRDEDERFRSVFIARTDSGITRLEDLRGREFVFGALGSATGHLVPRWYLMQSGIDPAKDLARFFYSGAHEATVNHVKNGRAVAGVLNSVAWKRLVEAGAVDTARVNAFYETGRFNDYLWAVRGDLDADLGNRLRETLLALDPKRQEDARILSLQRASRYIEVREADYAPHAAAARAVGLLK